MPNARVPLRLLPLLALLTPAAPARANQAVTLALLSRHTKIIDIFVDEHKEYTAMCQKVRTSPRKSADLNAMCRDRLTEIADNLDRENQRIDPYITHPDLDYEQRVGVTNIYRNNAKLALEARELARSFE